MFLPIYVGLQIAAMEFKQSWKGFECSSVLHVNLSESIFCEKVSVLFVKGVAGPVLRHIAGVDGEGKSNAGLMILEKPHKVILVFDESLLISIFLNITQ